jgi:hypothetical protein
MLPLIPVLCACFQRYIEDGTGQFDLGFSDGLKPLLYGGIALPDNLIIFERQQLQDTSCDAAKMHNLFNCSCSLDDLRATRNDSKHL